MARIHQKPISHHDFKVANTDAVKSDAAAKDDLRNRSGQYVPPPSSRHLPELQHQGKGSNQTQVALSNMLYKTSSKHHAGVKGAFISAAPTNGQAVLDTSTQIKATSPRRLAVDTNAQEFVVFDETVKGEYHGHVRSWDQLNDQMKALLRKQGAVNKKGRIQGAQRCAIKNPSPLASQTPSLFSQATTGRLSVGLSWPLRTAHWIQAGFRAIVLPPAEMIAQMCAALPPFALGTSPEFMVS